MTRIQCERCENYFLDEDVLTCPKCGDVYNIIEQNKRNNRILMLMIFLLIGFYLVRDIFLFFLH